MGAEVVQLGEVVARAEKLASWMEAVMEMIGDGVITTDLEGRVTSFNRAAEQITGVGREEAVGRIPKELFQSGFCPLETTLTERRGLPPRELNLRASDGSLVPVRVSTEVLRDQNGEVIGAVGVLRPGAPDAGGKLTSAVAATEREVLRAALKEAATSEEAARRLGIGRATLWRKLKKHGLSFPKR